MPMGRALRAASRALSPRPVPQERNRGHVLSWPWRAGQQGLMGGVEPGGKQVLTGSATPSGGVAVLIQLAQPPQGPISHIGSCPTGETEACTEGGVS